MPRRLTDRSLPYGLSSISPDANLFDELTEIEKRLDWTIARRRQEINDTLARGTLTTRRKLRIFMSHSVKNQEWQKPELAEPKVEDSAQTDGEAEAKAKLETGSGVPSWTFKIEGKIIHPPIIPSSKRQPPPQRRFSQIVRSLAIEMDRDPTIYADTNHVQWGADSRFSNYNVFGAYPSGPAASTNVDVATNAISGASPLDGFVITRPGDIPTTLRITIHLNHYPERFKVSPMLAALLGVYEDTRSNIAGAFWHYVKSNGLQDKNDRKLIKLDDRLKAIFKYESLNFQDIQVLLSTHMQPPDPLVLHYEIGTHCLDSNTEMDTSGPGTLGHLTPGGIGVNKDGRSAIKAFDIEMDMDDLWMRSKIADAILSMQPESMAAQFNVNPSGSNIYHSLQKADDDIKQSLQSLRNLRLRRDFFHSFASQPSTFIQNFLESQSRDLEVILGNERGAEGGGAGGSVAMGSGVDGGVRESDMLRSDFFQGDWVNEAVGVHEGMRMGQAVAAMHHAQHAQAQAQAQMHSQGMQGMGGMQMQMR